MKIAVDRQDSYLFDLTVDQLCDRTLYECDAGHIDGPILVNTIYNGTVSVRAATLFGSHNGLAYDLNVDDGLRKAKYRKFQGSVTLSE